MLYFEYFRVNFLISVEYRVCDGTTEDIEAGSMSRDDDFRLKFSPERFESRLTGDFSKLKDSSRRRHIFL